MIYISSISNEKKKEAKSVVKAKKLVKIMRRI